MADSWWCPKCGEQFHWDVAVCPDCNVDLVEQRPGPAPTPNVELLRVFVATDEALAEIAKSLLEGEKIEYLERFGRLQDLFGWGRFGTGFSYIVGPTEFWVCADEADHARDCLEGLEKSSPEDIVLPDNDNQQEPVADDTSLANPADRS